MIEEAPRGPIPTITFDVGLCVMRKPALDDDRQLRDEVMTLFLAGHRNDRQRPVLDVVLVVYPSGGGTPWK
jgi:hypothetical protein